MENNEVFIVSAAMQEIGKETNRRLTGEKT